MASQNDAIATAWKNDLDFLKIVCDLSGFAAALWRPGTSPKSGLVALVRYTELLYCHFLGSTISHEGIFIQDIAERTWSSVGALEEYQLAQSKNDRSHRSGIDFEKELLGAVKNGDAAAVKRLMGGTTPDFGEIGEVASERNKEYEYMMVAIIALMTRAAIEGGLRPEIAHEVGDVYLKKLALAALRVKSTKA